MSAIQKKFEQVQQQRLLSTKTIDVKLERGYIVFMQSATENKALKNTLLWFVGLCCLIPALAWYAVIPQPFCWLFMGVMLFGLYYLLNLVNNQYERPGEFFAISVDQETILNLRSGGRSTPYKRVFLKDVERFCVRETKQLTHSGDSYDVRIYAHTKNGGEFDVSGRFIHFKELKEAARIIGFLCDKPVCIQQDGGSLVDLDLL